MGGRGANGPRTLEQQWQDVQSYSNNIFSMEAELNRWEDEYNALRSQWQAEANQKFQQQLNSGEARLGLPDTNNARVQTIMNNDHVAEIRQWEERIRNRRKTLQDMNDTLRKMSENIIRRR